MFVSLPVPPLTSLCVSLSPLTHSRPLLCLSLCLIPWSASRPLFVPRSLSLCCLGFVCMRLSVCVSHTSCFSLSVSCPVCVPCSSLFPPVVCLPLCVFMSVSPSVMRRNLPHSLAVCSLPVRVVPSFFQFAFMYFAFVLSLRVCIMGPQSCLLHTTIWQFIVMEVSLNNDFDAPTSSMVFLTCLLFIVCCKVIVLDQIMNSEITHFVFCGLSSLFVLLSCSVHYFFLGINHIVDSPLKFLLSLW